MKKISSIFNYCFTHYNSYFVYNTLSTSLYKIDKNTYDFLKGFSSSEKEFLTEGSVYSALVNERLIVSSNEDEFITAKHYVTHCIYDNELQVTIVPTQGCNFRCKYCFENHSNISMSDESEKAIINFFKRNIKKYKSVKVSWFGGEPLLEKHRVFRIMEIIKKYCNENNIPMIAEMITNGYLLDVNTFNELVDKNILYYEITIDGLARFHNQYRPLVNGDGTFDRIVANLLDIRHQSKCKRYKIIIRTNYDKNTLPYYEQFVKELKELLDDNKHFEFLGSAISDWGGNAINTLRDALIDLEEIATPHYYENETVLLNRSLSQTRCSAGKYHGFVITPNASIHKCAKISFNASDLSIQDDNNLGFITSSGQIIWDESKVAKYISLPKMSEQCSKCCWVPICMLSVCPNTVVKGSPLACRMNNNNLSKITRDLVWMIDKGLYADLSNRSQGE